MILRTATRRMGEYKSDIETLVILFGSALSLTSSWLDPVGVIYWQRAEAALR
jgi:hypothetical protein